MTFSQTMAGHVPAIRILPVLAAWAGSLVVSSTASAQMDQLTSARMQDLHRSLVVAEENLDRALGDRDTLRARLVGDLLSTLGAHARERDLPTNSCLEALSGLEGTAVAITFFIHPISTGDVGNMTREELRFSDLMRPTDETLHKWFGEYSTLYRTKISDCERDIGVAKTLRTMPDTLTPK